MGREGEKRGCYISEAAEDYCLSSFTAKQADMGLATIYFSYSLSCGTEVCPLNGPPPTPRSKICLAVAVVHQFARKMKPQEFFQNNAISSKVTGI